MVLRLASQQVQRQILLSFGKPRPSTSPKKFPNFIDAYKLQRNFSTRQILQGRFDEKEAEARRKYEEALKSPSRIKRWGAIAGSKEFQKKMTKYYVLGYAILFVYTLVHLSKLFYDDKELEELRIIKESGAELSEYQQLRLKQLGGISLRAVDVAKLEQYLELKKEYDAKVKEGAKFKDIGAFDPQPNEIEEVAEPEHKKSFILPPRDTTEFYNNKAEDYDDEIKWEERFVFMGRRRKWAMRHLFGDVLEVSCGTGRNIPYLDLGRVNSITFLDSSEKMIEITNEKFREVYPKFKNAAFVVGKAEDLFDLANSNPKSQARYDTIVEAFGLCSHEDPVKALKNFKQLLKPGGRIILVEHGRGTYNFINKYLDTRAVKRLDTWGCRWNLDIGQIIDEAGLDIVSEKRIHFGTTWCVIAKHPDDPKKPSELNFYEKYFKGTIVKHPSEK